MPGEAKAGGSSPLTREISVDTKEIFERIRKKAESNIRIDGPVMKCLKFAIHPENYWRLKWDLLVFALVLYSSVAYVAAPYISICMACCACPRYERDVVLTVKGAVQGVVWPDGQSLGCRNRLYLLCGPFL